MGLRKSASAYDARANKSPKDNPYSFGFIIGKSCVSACRTLAPDQCYWALYCLRGYWEYSLRLIWGVRRPNGLAEVDAYYRKKFLEWHDQVELSDPLDLTPEQAAELANLRNDQTPPMNRNLIQALEDIWDADKANPVPSVFASHTDEYRRLMQLLHGFAHANPHFLQMGKQNHLDLAGQAVRTATIYLMRSMGYRLGWDQKTTVMRIISCGHLGKFEDE